MTNDGRAAVSVKVTPTLISLLLFGRANPAHTATSLACVEAEYDFG